MKKIQIALLMIILIFCCAGCSGEKKEKEELSSLFSEDTQDMKNNTNENNIIVDETDSDVDLNTSEAHNEEQAGANAGKSEADDGEKNKELGESSGIYIYVCGAVQHPGVYELSSHSRIYEAIEKAGGLLPDAAKEAVNQARLLKDGEQIYIPTQAELEEQKRNNEGESFGQFNPEFSEFSASESMQEAEEGKVNINTASKEELMSLTGIGATRAESILSYRKSNGGFDNIEELMEVEGIKEGVFNKIKDSITAGAGS